MKNLKKAIFLTILCVKNLQFTKFLFKDGTFQKYFSKNNVNHVLRVSP